MFSDGSPNGPGRLFPIDWFAKHCYFAVNFLFVALMLMNDHLLVGEPRGPRSAV